MAINTYQISNTNINPKRVFILQKSELEKRFDPEYYAHSYNEYDKKLRLKPAKKFNQIIQSINNGFDFRDYKETGTPYLKVANIRKGEFRFDKLQYIDFNSSEISKNIQLKKGNILLTRKGTFGYAIALDKDYDFVISSEVFYIEIKQDIINPKFLEIFFNSEIGQAQFDKNKIGAIMGSLSQDAIRELKIPYPSFEIQGLIVSIYENYIEQKQKNEAEAEKLLSSIDDYLLDELGIKLPQPPENTLKNRMFTRTLKQISNNRFDPFYYKEEFATLDKILENKLFVKFSTVIQVITKGETPLWKGESYVENGVPFLKVQNISTDGIYGDITFITEELHKSMTRSILKGGELLYTMAGSIGIATYLPKDFGEANINQAIAKIILKEHIEIDQTYLLAVINSVICKKQAERFLTVSAQPNINFDQIKAIKIPIPTVDKQKEIAKHITDIRNKAQQLKDKTKELLKKVNEEIEEILLK